MNVAGVNTFMDEKVLVKLEFVKVREKLSQMATSVLGMEAADKLLPSSSLPEVESRLKETDDAVEYLIKKKRPPLGGIRDIRHSIKRIEIGGILSPSELLAVSDVLRACRLLKSYLNEDEAID